MQDFDLSTCEGVEEAVKRNPDIVYMIAGRQLADENLSEEAKIKIRITLAVMKLRDKINIFWELSDVETDEAEQDALYNIHKDVLEYLQLINTGLDSFLASHNLSNKSA